MRICEQIFVKILGLISYGPVLAILLVFYLEGKSPTMIILERLFRLKSWKALYKKGKDPIIHELLQLLMYPLQEAISILVNKVFNQTYKQ